ncbi:MAG: hypothetical protein GZ089_04330 [Aromatoleum sp.]|nr:hypothetical protein [Aromatoleum sp.]
MKIAGFCLLLGVALSVPECVAADAGMVTLVEGPARILRGVTWYKLLPGAILQDGDVIDAAAATKVQAEVAGGPMLHLVGPALLYAAAIPPRGDGTSGTGGAVEFDLEHGWLKVASTVDKVAARLRTSGALVAFADATVVLRADPTSTEIFVESGAARITEMGRSGKPGSAHDATAGEYWSQGVDRSITTQRGAPAKFVAAMPRHLTERLGSFAARHKGQSAAFTADRDIALAEADVLLAGPYRKTFVRRFSSRLADPAFRKEVDAGIAAYPEWDRVLHPEKFRPRP